MLPPKIANKPYHHGDLHNALIAAGLALLNEGGAAALDLRKVARQAGVSHGAPYRHFADKQALLAAIAEEGFEQLVARLQIALEEAPNSFFDQLLSTAQAYVRFAIEKPALMREMFSGVTIERMTYPTLYSTSKTALNLIIELIQRGQEQENLIPGDPINLTLVAWSQIHGLAMLLVEKQLPHIADDPAAIDQLIRFCIQTLYNGLAQK